MYSSPIYSRVAGQASVSARLPLAFSSGGGPAWPSASDLVLAVDLDGSRSVLRLASGLTLTIASGLSLRKGGDRPDDGRAPELLAFP